MRNLWLFLSRYNAFFFFLIFFIASLVIFVRNNSYQRASVLNSSNQIVGQAFETVNYLQTYLHLAQVNDSLAAENARLRNSLRSSFYSDSVVQANVLDTLYRQQYTYIVAEVVNNSIHQKNNTITINRGRKQGVQRDMGVICPSGVVGVVLNVSDNFATVQSLLNSDSHISATIKESNAFGSLVWGEENFDPRVALLKDIPNHINVKKGQHVVTSGFSTKFPRGLPIGRIKQTDIRGGESFLDIEVALNTDFSTLQYVYVVKNLMQAEKQQVEAIEPAK